MTSLEALVALNMVADIGSIRLQKLLEHFDKPQNILTAPRGKLIAVSGIGDAIASQITSLKKEILEQEFKQASKLGLKILVIDDNDYPQNLKNIPGAPIVLYVKGELRKGDKTAIGIVGSRRASFYGQSNAERFAFDLSEKGFTIISGMARGIDTCAHKGALKQGGRTIAVIGSGFNNIYPEDNIELSEEIAGNGAVISEFPVNTPPYKANFPRRNRVISGLSLGLLVVEAAQNSGALITADFALEQGREVFALPGKVDSGNSFGTNELIKQGAKLVSCTEDILEELAMPQAKAPGPGKDLPQGQNTVLNKEEDSVYAVISRESLDLDELAEKTSLDIPRISDILLRLQLKKLIKQLPGKQFVRSQNEN